MCSDIDDIIVFLRDCRYLVTRVLEWEERFYYVMRFQVEMTEKFVHFIGENPESVLETISSDRYPWVSAT